MHMSTTSSVRAGMDVTNSSGEDSQFRVGNGTTK
jgi:hypothetical protein